MFFKKSKPKNLYRIRYTTCFDIDNRNSNNIKTTIEFNDCSETYIAAMTMAEAVAILFRNKIPANGRIFIRDVTLLTIHSA